MIHLKSFSSFNEELVELKCPICGSRLYQTHSGGNKIPYQCSSEEAAYWKYPRGSKLEKKAHEHFMKSMTYVDRLDKSLTESRVPNPNAFNFTVDERDLFEDLLLEYIDKYDMKEMPKDEEGYHFFDDNLPNIQYLVQRLANIGIDIESINIPLNEVFDDIKKHFVPRVERYGYHVYYCELNRETLYNFVTEPSVKYSISITIMQKD